MTGPKPHVVALVGNLNMRFYLSFMLYCKLQRYNHTNIYVLKCVNVEHKRGMYLYRYMYTSIWARVNLVPQTQVLAAWRINVTIC